MGAAFNTDNMGIGALTCGILQSIIHNLPDSEIVIVDYSRTPDSYQFIYKTICKKIRLVNIRFSKNIFLNNNIANMFVASILRKLFRSSKINGNDNINNPISEIISSDVVVSISGGDSFSDIYGRIRFYYMSLPQIVAIILNKKLVLLPQTIGPFANPATKMVAKYILNHSHVIYSRDQSGIDEIKKIIPNIGRTQKIKFCYDMGFILEPRKPENIGLPEHIVKRRRGRAIVGLNVSGLLFMGGYTKKNMFALRDEYPNLVREIIRKFIEDMNTDVILIPHVFGETNGSESDLLVCREIYDEWNKTYENRIFLPSGSYNQNEIKYIISLCDFFVGSRMHACIAALSQHIPAISIAYSKKFQGVLNTIGVEDLVVDPRVLPIEDIIRIIEEVYSRRDTIRKKLEEIIPSVKSTVMDLFNPNGPIFQ